MDASRAAKTLEHLAGTLRGPLNVNPDAVASRLMEVANDLRQADKYAPVGMSSTNTQQVDDPFKRFDLMVRNWFTYHPPAPGQTQRYEQLHSLALILAQAIVRECPMGADRSHALGALRDAVMWANASIVCNEPEYTPENR